MKVKKMREILFRGKSVINDEWVEGYYYKAKYYRSDSELCDYITIPYPTVENKPSDHIMVIPETIGQYTGLTDKNGKKIFEGDIAESRASKNRDDWKKWIVLFQDGSFCFNREIPKKRKHKYEENLLCVDEIELYGLVVIGNIYDNPELLKGGAEE